MEARAYGAQCCGVDLPRGVHLIVDVERRDRARPAAVDRQVYGTAGGLAWLDTVVERSSIATSDLTMETGVKYSPPRLPSLDANSPMKYS